MIGFKGSDPIFVEDFVDSDLTKCLRVIATQLGGSNWGEGKCGYGNFTFETEKQTLELYYDLEKKWNLDERQE